MENVKNYSGTYARAKLARAAEPRCEEKLETYDGKKICLRRGVRSPARR